MTTRRDRDIELECRECGLGIDPNQRDAVYLGQRYRNAIGIEPPPELRVPEMYAHAGCVRHPKELEGEAFKQWTISQFEANGRARLEMRVSISRIEKALRDTPGDAFDELRSELADLLKRTG